MAKVGIFASIFSISLALGYASLQSTAAEAAGECKRTEFKTKLVQAACAKGGQKAAKDDMKAWLKTAKTKNSKIEGCPTCHAKVGGDYPLKPDALTLFADSGGELIDAKAAKTPPAKAAPAPAAPAAPPTTK